MMYHRRSQPLYTERIHYIFREFDNVMIALSASVESTLLLELTHRIWREHYRHRKVCVFNVDTEIVHSYSVMHLMNSFESVKNDFELYWIMLPTKIKHTLFEKEETFLSWDASLERLLRPYPALPYVVTLENNPIPSYRYGMPARMLASAFLKWYKRENLGGRTVFLTGARLEEEHNASDLLNENKRYRNSDWIRMSVPDIWRAAPMYDFSLRDVWIAVSKLGIDYNAIYDLLYKRGDAPEDFRITPQLSKDKYAELRRFAELDGIIWSELTRRINGIEVYSDYGDPRELFAEKRNTVKNKENDYEKSRL